jgi:uncharacterized protein YdaU (DUF1376 family)
VGRALNYYEHHLGDYLRDTAHLSMLEDAAYRRLLDAYYIREKALPLDVRECCKLVRATSKQERDAVAYVLREFFRETEDGYRQKRADAEIARFQEKQAKAKRSAEARWSAKRTESEGNANASADAMRTHSEGNAPRARPQTPDTRHQTPENPEAARSEVTIPRPEKPPRAALPDPVPKPEAPTRRGGIAVLLRSQGVACAHAHPTVVEWDHAGVTDEQLREAVSVARMRKPHPEAIPIAYLAPIVRELVAKPVDAGGLRERDWSRIWPDEPAEVSP